MTLDSLLHLTDDELVRSIRSQLVRDSKNTAVLIARLAEVDRRKLYRPAGYSAMYLYCVHEFGMSEAVAYKRTRAARVVRRFPVVLAAIADRRLHLDAVKLLSKHFRRHNVEPLIAAAAHRTSREVRALIAERFPMPDLPTSVRPILPRTHARVSPSDAPLAERATASDEIPAPAHEVTQSSELAARPVQDIPLNIPALT